MSEIISEYMYPGHTFKVFLHPKIGYILQINNGFKEHSKNIIKLEITKENLLNLGNFFFNLKNYILSISTSKRFSWPCINGSIEFFSEKDGRNTQFEIKTTEAEMKFFRINYSDPAYKNLGKEIIKKVNFDLAFFLTSEDYQIKNK